MVNPMLEDIALFRPVGINLNNDVNVLSHVKRAGTLTDRYDTDFENELLLAREVGELIFQRPSNTTNGK